MNNKLIRVNTKNLYFIVIGIIVVTRCYGANLFSSQTKGIVLFAVTVLAIVKSKIHVDFLDLLWMVTGGVVLFHHSSGYSQIYIIFFQCALVSRFIIKKNVSSVKMLMKILLIFSIVTSIVSWISLALPSVYISYIVPIINESGHQEVLNGLAKGNLAGLTDHYSRNAYYVVAGILVLLSKVWKNQSTKILFKQNKKEWILIIFEVTTLLAIGKRGHLIFLLMTAYIIFLILQRTYSRRVINSLKAIAVVAIVAILIFRFIPSTQHTVERFIMKVASDDVSNGRFTNYAIAFRLFKENPVIGIGYGGFNQLTANGLTKYTYAGVHNDYIQFLCETGIFGFVFFIGLGIQSLISAIISLKRIVVRDGTCDTEMRYIAVWALLFQLFVMLYSFTGIPHFDFEINTVYLVTCATSTAISRAIKKDIVAVG